MTQPVDYGYSPRKSGRSHRFQMRARTLLTGDKKLRDYSLYRLGNINSSQYAKSLMPLENVLWPTLHLQPLRIPSQSLQTTLVCCPFPLIPCRAIMSTQDFL